MTLEEALEWAQTNTGDEVVGRLRSRQVVVALAAEIDRLRTENAALRKDAELANDAVRLVKQCRGALAEELAAWDIDPPLRHVKEAHDSCVEWLARIAE